MLPISLVLNVAFIAWVKLLDPSFNIPGVKTLKNGVYKIQKEIKLIIRQKLTKIDHPNIILDMWSDAKLLGYMGLTCIGINYDWE